MWNGTKFYFHVAPTHRDNKRWFRHTCASCSTCNKWKANKEEKINDANSKAPTAALSDLTPDPASEGEPDAEILLAAAFDSVAGTQHADFVQTYIADALKAIRS